MASSSTTPLSSGKKGKRKGDDSGGGAKGKIRKQTFCESYKTVGGIVKSPMGAEFARCEYCNADIKISHGGMHDIQEHLKTKKHKSRLAMAKDAKSSMKIVDLLPSGSKTTQESELDQNVIRAEALMTETIVKLNIPLSAADTLTKTVKAAFFDSQIAKKYSCCRNKTTDISYSEAEMAVSVTFFTLEHLGEQTTCL